MNKFAATLLAFAVLGTAGFAQEEETGGESEPILQYLPPYVFPAVYVYGGAARGPSYDAASDITGRAAAAGLDDELADVGTLSAVGVTFDFFIGPYVAASQKLMHEQDHRHGLALKYDFATFPKAPPPLSSPHRVEERLSYAFQNVDYKLALKYVPLPRWPITPYAAVGVGVNLTSMDVDDEVSNAVLQKSQGGGLLATGWFQQFSFDWALYAGLQINLGDHFFFIAEYNYDRQFHEHEVAGYRYNTGLRALYAGAGWRFI